MSASGYNLFVQDYMQQYRRTGKNENALLVKLAAALWRRMNDHSREPWERKAAEIRQFRDFETVPSL